MVLCAVRRRPITAFGRSLTLPSLKDALSQLVLGVVDNGIAAAILWILLPHGGPSYVTFVGAYAVACIVGLASSVPGGAGVFESAMAALLPGVDAGGAGRGVPGLPAGLLHPAADPRGAGAGRARPCGRADASPAWPARW